MILAVLQVIGIFYVSYLVIRSGVTLGYTFQGWKEMKETQELPPETIFQKISLFMFLYIMMWFLLPTFFISGRSDLVD
jgi:hypothetical protein